MENDKLTKVLADLIGIPVFVVVFRKKKNATSL